MGPSGCGKSTLLNLVAGLDVAAGESVGIVASELLENAIKYGEPQGGISVEIKLGRLKPNDRPYLEVADRGAGIDARSVDRIFEPFFTGPKGGTGLGLFISRELCQLNRAILLYEPRLGGGSVFRIVFTDPQRWED